MKNSLSDQILEKNTAFLTEFMKIDLKRDEGKKYREIIEDNIEKIYDYIENILYPKTYLETVSKEPIIFNNLKFSINFEKKKNVVQQYKLVNTSENLSSFLTMTFLMKDGYGLLLNGLPDTSNEKPQNHYSNIDYISNTPDQEMTNFRTGTMSSFINLTGLPIPIAFDTTFYKNTDILMIERIQSCLKSFAGIPFLRDRLGKIFYNNSEEDILVFTPRTLKSEKYLTTSPYYCPFNKSFLYPNIVNRFQNEPEIPIRSIIPLYNIPMKSSSALEGINFKIRKLFFNMKTGIIPPRLDVTLENFLFNYDAYPSVKTLTSLASRVTVQYIQQYVYDYKMLNDLIDNFDNEKGNHFKQRIIQNQLYDEISNEKLEIGYISAHSEEVPLFSTPIISYLSKETFSKSEHNFSFNSPAKTLNAWLGDFRKNTDRNLKNIPLKEFNKESLVNYLPCLNYKHIPEKDVIPKSLFAQIIKEAKTTYILKMLSEELENIFRISEQLQPSQDFFYLFTSNSFFEYSSQEKEVMDVYELSGANTAPKKSGIGQPDSFSFTLYSKDENNVEVLFYQPFPYISYVDGGEPLSHNSEKKENNFTRETFEKYVVDKLFDDNKINHKKTYKNLDENGEFMERFINSLYSKASGDEIARVPFITHALKCVKIQILKVQEQLLLLSKNIFDSFHEEFKEDVDLETKVEKWCEIYNEFVSYSNSPPVKLTGPYETVEKKDRFQKDENLNLSSPISSKELHEWLKEYVIGKKTSEELLTEGKSSRLKLALVDLNKIIPFSRLISKNYFIPDTMMNKLKLNKLTDKIFAAIQNYSFSNFSLMLISSCFKHGIFIEITKLFDQLCEPNFGHKTNLSPREWLFLLFSVDSTLLVSTMDRIQRDEIMKDYHKNTQMKIALKTLSYVSIFKSDESDIKYQLSRNPIMYRLFKGIALGYSWFPNHT